MRAEYGTCEDCGNEGMCLDGLCHMHHQQYLNVEAAKVIKELAGNTDLDQAIEMTKSSLQVLCEILLLKEQNQKPHEKTMIGAAINVLISNVESLREFDK